MLPGLSISRAGADDYELVHAVMMDARCWLQNLHGIDQWNWLTIDVARERILRRITLYEVYLVLDDNRPISTATLQYTDVDFWSERGEDGTAGYIHGLATAHCAKGKGVGSSLIRWAEKRFMENGKSLSRLDCVEANPRIRAYYESLGYMSAGRKVFPNGFTSTLYERRIIQQ